MHFRIHAFGAAQRKGQGADREHLCISGISGISAASLTGAHGSPIIFVVGYVGVARRIAPGVIPEIFVKFAGNDGRLSIVDGCA